MMGRSAFIVVCILVIGCTCTLVGSGGVQKVEERTRYIVAPLEGVHIDVVVIRWHLDHEMNSIALKHYAALEVAEQRRVRLFGKYHIEKSPDENGHYAASVFASDGETGRTASARIRGVGREVVTIRVVSWGLREDEHRTRAAALIERFEADKAPNKAPEPTPTAVTPRAIE